jgi:threonine dehydratase
MAEALCVSLPDIQAAVTRIRALGVKETPVMTSELMDELAGYELFFKCELFQKTGSFKARGASNACSLLPEGQAVVTHSSGNHAQAIAFAAQATNRHAVVVMPTNAPLPKQVATQGYGAEVILCQPTNEHRVQGAAEQAKRTGGAIVHPSENPHVIAGQGTVALEMLSQVQAMIGGGGGGGEGAAADPALSPPLDVLIVPVGGGGLASGCAVAAKALWPDMLVVGAEPAAMDDAFRSKQAGELCGNEKGATSIAGMCEGTERNRCNFLLFWLCSSIVIVILFLSRCFLHEIATNQPTNQSIDRSIDQSIDRRVAGWLRLYFHQSIDRSIAQTA